MDYYPIGMNSTLVDERQLLGHGDRLSKIVGRGIKHENFCKNALTQLERG